MWMPALAPRLRRARHLQPPPLHVSPAGHLRGRALRGGEGSRGTVHEILHGFMYQNARIHGV